MAGKFGGFDDDEEDVLAPKEPQVTSQDPIERKAARALRIKRRQDALKRAEQTVEDIILEEEPGLIEQATASAAEELQRLALDGAAKVTNVKVTTDEREVIRRRLLADKMLNSMEKIENEANDAQTQYESISSNWDGVLQIKDPLDIDAEMKKQKQKCNELLEQKNVLINELKDDLKKLDQAYYDDLQKQDNDIKELSDRVEKQVSIMQRAYEKQLSLIEQAINIEREAMVEHNNKRWEALYKQRDKEEVAHMEFKFEQLDEHKLEIEAIMWDHQEKYREAKIELESLIQELQKELEKLKATCIINTEKIGYNYQVLKKREEENVFVRSQQKRKLNKMSDVANALRSKIRKAAEDGAIEEIKADNEIVKLMQTMDDLEKKSLHFSHVNHYKFSQIWRMAAARCSELARELRQAEVSVHAHILSEPPPPPPPPPPKSPLLKLEAEENKKAVNINDINNKVLIHPNNMVAKDAKDKLVRHILQLVADNTGFLVEDRLLMLLEKYKLDSRNLCTLDSIFLALEIQAEEDIELLCKTFLKYAFCPICIGLDRTSQSDMPNAMPHEDLPLQEYASFCVKSSRMGDKASIRDHTSSVVRSISASTSRSAHTGLKGPELSVCDQQLLLEADEIIQKCGDPQVTLAVHDVGTAMTRRGHRGVTVLAQPGLSQTHNPFLCAAGHYLEIEPMQVLMALGEFMSVFVPPEKRKLYDILDSVKPPEFSTPSRQLSVEETIEYWAQWKNMFLAEKDRFWDGLLAGMNSYLPILQERQRLNEEVSTLRRRNASLRRLARGGLPVLTAKVPRYALPRPPGFIAPFADNAARADARLPPI